VLVVLVRRGSPVPALALSEDGVAGDVYSLGDRVVEAVRLGAVLIADEHDLDTAIVKLAKVWTGLLDVGHTPEHL
jgi:hypothetical protein